MQAADDKMTKRVENESQSQLDRPLCYNSVTIAPLIFALDPCILYRNQETHPMKND